MNRWQLLGAGLAVYALALLVTAPATLIDARLAQASSGGVRLAEAAGTLWSGTGQLEILDSNRSGGIAKSIAWHIRPAYLLRGELRFDITLNHATHHFPVTISFARIQIANADITLPAAALALGIPKLAALGLTGDVQLHIARLAVGRGSVQGNATLQWHDAGSAFTRVSPLGDYTLRLEGDGTTVHASLHTLRGPLQLDGLGSWESGHRPVFQGNARVPPPQQQQLAPLLRMIAVEHGQGRFSLRLN